MTHTIKAATEGLLKTDVLGRVKTPARRREQLLDEFERSGLSGQQFAALTGIKYQTFATWAQKRRRTRGADARGKVPAPAPDPVRWLEAVVEPAPTPGGPSAASLVLQLPGVRLLWHLWPIGVSNANKTYSNIIFANGDWPLWLFRAPQ
jgi:hypothetical protein